MTKLLEIFFALLLFCSAAFAADAPPAGTAALVNGAVITTAQYRGELARVLRLRKKMEHDLDPSTRAATKKEALETLIGRELLYQESQRSGIKIKDSEVDAEIASLRKQFPSENDFNNSLGKMELSTEAVKTQIRHGMAIQALTDSRFAARLVMTEKELFNYYEIHQDSFALPAQFRLSHILVKHGDVVSNSSTTTARSRIDALNKRLIQGEDFALLARESDDSASSGKGGDLGYFSAGQLDRKLESAAFVLAAGQTSQVVEDRFGYHILKVTERQPRKIPSFENVREKVRKQLLRERLTAEMTPYLKRLRDSAKVEIHLTE